MKNNDSIKQLFKVLSLQLPCRERDKNLILCGKYIQDNMY